MITPLIRFGNSKGVRIPKAFLDKCGNPEEVEMEEKKGLLLIRPKQIPATPRKGWEAAGRRMAKLGDDRLLDAGNLPATEWDKTEWEW
jgi:antitoxin MazE